MKTDVYAELNEDKTKIVLRYKLKPALLPKFKGLARSRFKNKGKDPDPDEAYWTIPADIDGAIRLRDVFGEELSLGPHLKAWSKGAIENRKSLAALALANSGDIADLATMHEELWRSVHVGPKIRDMDEDQIQAALQEAGSYQAADVVFGVACPNPIIANQPGLGKTLEAMAIVAMADTKSKCHLTIAPLTSLDTVWGWHLDHYIGGNTIVVPQGRRERIRTMQMAMEMFDEGESFWLVANPAMLTLDSTFTLCAEHEEMAEKGKLPAKAYLRKCFGCEEEKFLVYPEFEDIEWGCVVADEFHMCGLTNPSTLTAGGFMKLNAEKKIGLSGTPLRGKPINIYGILHWLYPQVFTSKWGFAEQWLEIEDTSYGKQIHGVIAARQKEFDEFLTQYMVRRTKAECVPWLPPVQVVDLWVTKTEKQAKQYREFELAAEIRIDDYKLSAVGILAEYTRLKQFSNAVQNVRVLPQTDPDKPPQLILEPTKDSPKLPEVERLLAERGIVKGDDAEGDEQVVIFSESARMIDMVHEWLNEDLGIPAGKISGAVSKPQRDRLQEQFQAEGGLRVMCLVTTAGGVSITLDRASTAIILDETWVPDEQEQAVDRIHRVSRIHQVTAYFIRTRETIQEYIQTRVEDKASINKNILDIRRQRLLTK